MLLRSFAWAALACLPLASAPAHADLASWYGPGFHGRQTANGERFDQNEMTAAHKTLPFGTWVRVTNRATGRSVVVRINDRGPYVGGRAIDLSRGAARAVGCAGVCRVELKVGGRRQRGLSTSILPGRSRLAREVGPHGQAAPTRPS